MTVDEKLERMRLLGERLAKLNSNAEQLRRDCRSRRNGISKYNSTILEKNLSEARFAISKAELTLRDESEQLAGAEYHRLRAIRTRKTGNKSR